MAINPTIIRTRPKLSDYLFDQDKTKFKLNKKSSRPWIINNEKDKSKMKNVLDDNLVTDFENIVSIHRGADSSTFLEKESNKEKRSGINNYPKISQESVNNSVSCCDIEKTKGNGNGDRNNLKSSHFMRKDGQLDNVNMNQHSKYIKQSPKSQRKYQKSLKARDQTKVYAQEEDTEEDRMKQQLLERDIELEYQQQVNKMFNNQQSAHLLTQMNQTSQTQTVHQNMNQAVYPPLYLQGPHGLYYVLVPPPNNYISPPPDRYIAEYPGSIGDMSDNESSDDCESLGDSFDTDFKEVDNLKKYEFMNNFEEVNNDETADIDFEMQSDEQLTRLVLSIIDE